MKKLLPLFLVLVLLLSLPVHAAQPKVIDQAGLLTDTQAAELEESAQALAERYQMDVVILTVDSLGRKSAEAFADDYFDENGYGIGSSHSGILFLLSMEDRDWAISTCGNAIQAVTDYGVESIFSSIASYLSDDRYYEAFCRYLRELDRYFAAYESGSPIHGSTWDYNGPGSYEPASSDQDEKLTLPRILLRLVIALAIGAGIAALVLWSMKKQMNTATRQSGASNYISPGSYQLYRNQDRFLYSTTSRVRRAENSGSSSGGRSGSSTHRSSSGRSHGGGHGKF